MINYHINKKINAIYIFAVAGENIRNGEKVLGNTGGLYQGEAFQTDDFGNYNFGVAAKAFGIYEWFAKMGAGIYQINSGTSKWSYWNSLGDDPRDQRMIERGYNHFK